MRLYTIKTAEGTFPAVQGTNNTLHKLPFADMNEVIASGKVHEFDELTATDGAYSIDTVAILAPIPNPLQDILCGYQLCRPCGRIGSFQEGSF